MNHNLSIPSMSSKILGFLVLLVMSYTTEAQDVRLTNPSFEDKPRRGTFNGVTYSPQIVGWYDCGRIFFPRATPPDIHDGQSGYWDSEISAAQGKTYMTMVVREDDTYESVSQKLLGTLKAGQCYKFSIALVRSETYLSPTQLSRNMEKNFTEPAVLRVYGGRDYCPNNSDDGELLAESIPITNGSWKTYEFIITPQSDLTHIALEAFFVVPTIAGYNGHICIDDASMFTQIDCETEEALFAEAEPKKKKKPKKKPVPSFKKKPKKDVAVKTRKDNDNTDALVYKKPKKKILEELDRDKIKIGQLIKLKHLHFDADSARITDVSYSVLNEVYDFMNEYKEVQIEVGGHTNNVPAHDYCDKLSTDRARAVAKYLISKGIDENRITYKGYGKRKPLVNNTTKKGRMKNQRVQIKITSLG